MCGHLTSGRTSATKDLYACESGSARSPVNPRLRLNTRIKTPSEGRGGSVGKGAVVVEAPGDAGEVAAGGATHFRLE